MSQPTVPAAILAGGKATRLGSIARDLPKSLVPVAGQPFIDHQLALLRRNGIERVVLCLGHLGSQIVDHVGDGSAIGLDVRYSFDGDEPLGTGGALLRAQPLLGALFWVLYGDSYLDFDYPSVLAHFQQRTEPALLTVYRNANKWDRSNADFRDGRVVAFDKVAPTPQMELIDYGAALLRPAALRLASGERFDLADLYRVLASEGLLAGYEVHQRFYEVGSPGGLADAARRLATGPQLASS